MSAATGRAKYILLSLVTKIVLGTTPAPAEQSRLRSRLALFGFRRTVRSWLLDKLTTAGRGAAGAVIFVPALGGKFTIAVRPDDCGVGAEILQTGAYEPHLAAFYQRFIKPGMSILDVGANIGFHALHAAALGGPAGRVYAVEPDPANTTLLNLSLSLSSSRAPVEVIQAALSDARGELVLTDLGNPANSGARFTHRDRALLERLVHGPEPTFGTVRAFRWDDERLETGLDLVKIDIEGYEPFALAGMEKSLERHRPVVLSEFAPSNLRQIGGVEPAAFLDSFRRRGYDAAFLRDDGGLAPESNDELLARTAGAHHIDVVFTPRGDGRR